MTKPNIETPIGDATYKFIEDSLLDFNLGNVIKYVMKFKNSGSVDNLMKARWFIEREIRKTEEYDKNRSNC